MSLRPAWTAKKNNNNLLYSHSVLSMTSSLKPPEIHQCSNKLSLLLTQQKGYTLGHYGISHKKPTGKDLFWDSCSEWVGTSQKQWRKSESRVRSMIGYPSKSYLQGRISEESFPCVGNLTQREVKAVIGIRAILTHTSLMFLTRAYRCFVSFRLIMKSSCFCLDPS